MPHRLCSLSAGLSDATTASAPSYDTSRFSQSFRRVHVTDGQPIRATCVYHADGRCCRQPNLASTALHGKGGWGLKGGSG